MSPKRIHYSRNSAPKSNFFKSLTKRSFRLLLFFKQRQQKKTITRYKNYFYKKVWPFLRRRLVRLNNEEEGIRPEICSRKKILSMHIFELSGFRTLLSSHLRGYLGSCKCLLWPLQKMDTKWWQQLFFIFLSPFYLFDDGRPRLWWMVKPFFGVVFK